ncbi:MAG: hypothetical protein AAGD11_20800 [Planctomycetota bacterium]
MNARPLRLAAVVLLATLSLGRTAFADLPVPAGLQPGDTYHLLFNSSTFTNALSSSIDFYNNFVQAAADAAGIGDSAGVTWKAIVSTASIDARNNAIVGVNTPVYNTRGGGSQRLADGFSDLWDGALDQFPAYTETGNVNTVDPWTGSTPAGLRATGSTLGHPSGTAWCGRPTQLGGQWITFFEPSTLASLPVYALSEELTVPDADFDGDSDVDGDDLLRWQRGQGDADSNGTSDAADLTYWNEQYGRGATGSSQALSVVSVPEPASALLLCISATIFVTAQNCCQRKRCRRANN